jgi:hypothetical protein
MNRQSDAEIAKYDRQPRSHHECCDPARAILTMRKEISENVPDIIRRASLWQRLKRWAGQPSRRGNMSNGGYVLITILGVAFYGWWFVIGPLLVLLRGCSV